MVANGSVVKSNVTLNFNNHVVLVYVTVDSELFPRRLDVKQGHAMDRMPVHHTYSFTHGEIYCIQFT